MRDPRVDPAPGDVVCSEAGTSCLVVDEVADGAVRCRIRTMGRPDKLTAPLLEEWRAVASLCVPLADRLDVPVDELLAEEGQEKDRGGG